jgi:hypothetical protein
MASTKNTAASSTDKSTQLPSGDVNKGATRGSATAPTPTTIGPRSNG